VSEAKPPLLEEVEDSPEEQCQCWEGRVFERGEDLFLSPEERALDQGAMFVSREDCL
jgi:hypothetical protein